MIYFLVKITIAPGKMGEFSELAGKYFIPVWERHGGKLIGGWETATGTMNEVVDLWCFESMAHYEKSSLAFKNDPELREMWPKLIGTVWLGENNVFLRPLPFSPLK